jgi:hypothetical protein
MAWRVDVDERTAVVRVIFDGAIGAGDLRDASLAAINAAKARGALRYFVDAEQALFDVSAFTILSLPDKQYIEEHVDRRSRIAVLLPVSPKARDDVRFYETVCLNRGWTVRCFSTPSGAADWLIGPAAFGGA